MFRLESSSVCILSMTTSFAAIPSTHPPVTKTCLKILTRSCQLGKKAWRHMLLKLTTGRESSTPETSRKVIVLDPNPNFGDVLEAIWDLNDSWTKGSEIPLFVGMGFYHSSLNEHEKSKAAGVNSFVKGFLLRLFWETSREAGEAEPRHTPETTVERPILQKLAWDGSTGKAMVPDMIKDRFNDAEEAVREEWGQLMRHTKDWNCQQGPSASNVANPKAAHSQS